MRRICAGLSSCDTTESARLAASELLDFLSPIPRTHPLEKIRTQRGEDAQSPINRQWKMIAGGFIHRVVEAMERGYQKNPRSHGQISGKSGLALSANGLALWRMPSLFIARCLAERRRAKHFPPLRSPLSVRFFSLLPPMGSP